MLSAHPAPLLCLDQLYKPVLCIGSCQAKKPYFDFCLLMHSFCVFLSHSLSLAGASLSAVISESLFNELDHEVVRLSSQV